MYVSELYELNNNSIALAEQQKHHVIFIYRIYFDIN